MGVFVKPIEERMFPIQDIAPLYARQAITDIRVAFHTQRIYPTEVYAGYRKVNEQRRKRGMWYSTGNGASSFDYKVYQADKETGNLTVGVSFNDYLRYADIGVGLAGRPSDPAAHITADKVQRSKDVNWKSRYISGKWNKRQGKSHRPAIMRTLRRLRRRYETYLADFYGYQGQVYIINAFAGMGASAKS